MNLGPLFRDRAEAGRRLAVELCAYAGQPDLLVLGMPRGGVSVAFEVAQYLHAPLDVMVVRKLGVPGHPELAMGAIATGGVKVINHEIVHRLGISEYVLGAAAIAEEMELKRRERVYRGHRSPVKISGKTVILVDDGIATGSTMRAAIQALRRHQPVCVIVGVPIAAPSAYDEFEELTDEMVILAASEDFYAVGEAYDDFTQVTDEEVTWLMEHAGAAHIPPS